MLPFNLHCILNLFVIYINHPLVIHISFFLSVSRAGMLMQHVSCWHAMCPSSTIKLVETSLWWTRSIVSSSRSQRWILYWLPSSVRPSAASSPARPSRCTNGSLFSCENLFFCKFSFSFLLVYIIFQVIGFLKNKKDFIGQVLKHLDTSAMMDLVLRLISSMEPVCLRQEVLTVSAHDLLIHL